MTGRAGESRVKHLLYPDAARLPRAAVSNPRRKAGQPDCSAHEGTIALRDAGGGCTPTSRGHGRRSWPRGRLGLVPKTRLSGAAFGPYRVMSRARPVRTGCARAPSPVLGHGNSEAPGRRVAWAVASTAGSFTVVGRDGTRTTREEDARLPDCRGEAMRRQVARRGPRYLVGPVRDSRVEVGSRPICSLGEGAAGEARTIDLPHA